MSILDITERELGTYAGVSQAAIWQWKEKEILSKTIKKKLVKFVETYNVDMEWLSTGQGEPIKRKKLTGLKQRPPDNPIQSMFEWMQRIERRLDELERQSKKDIT